MPSEQQTSMLRAIAASARPSVEVSWTTPFSTPVWEELCRLDQAEREHLRIPQSAENKKPRQVSLGPVLYEPKEPRIASLYIARPSEPPEGQEFLQWQLEVKHSPPDEPPDFVKKLSAGIGGRTGMSDLIQRGLGGDGLTVATYEIKFFMDGEHWNCRSLPRQLIHEFDTPILEISPNAVIEHIGYRLPEGANGIFELTVTFLHEQPMHMVVARARGTLKLSQESWLPFADEVRNLIVAKLFSRKEPKT